MRFSPGNQRALCASPSQAASLWSEASWGVSAKNGPQPFYSFWSFHVSAPRPLNKYCKWVETPCFQLFINPRFNISPGKRGLAQMAGLLQLGFFEQMMMAVVVVMMMVMGWTGLMAVTAGVPAVKSYEFKTSHTLLHSLPITANHNPHYLWTPHC